MEFYCTPKPTEELSIRHCTKLKERCGNGSSAEQSGPGFSLFQISTLVNLLNKKQFEDHIHY